MRNSGPPLLTPAAQVALRIENERYLRAHPELQTMLSSFMASVLRDRPDDVVKHAVAFFHTHPQLHDAAQ